MGPLANPWAKTLGTRSPGKRLHLWVAQYTHSKLLVLVNYDVPGYRPKRGLSGQISAAVLFALKLFGKMHLSSVLLSRLFALVTVLSPTASLSAYDL